MKSLALVRRRLIVSKKHQCVPTYRGAGHAYAYCAWCGRAMKAYPQALHETSKRLNQLIVGNNMLVQPKIEVTAEMKDDIAPFAEMAKHHIAEQLANSMGAREAE